MKTLNDITRDALDIIDMIEASEGEITKEIEAAMAINADDFAAKADAYASVINELKALAAARAEQIKKLTSIKRSAENAAERMAQRLLDTMQLIGLSKQQTDSHVISIRTNAESVVVDDETALPDGAWVTRREVSKTLIKQLMADGEVPGAHMERKQSLSIR